MKRRPQDQVTIPRASFKELGLETESKKETKEGGKWRCRARLMTRWWLGPDEQSARWHSQLAKAGKKVAILERGPRVTRPGTITGMLGAVDLMGMVPTLTSPSIVRGIALGGSTLLFCGTAAIPSDWLKTKYNLDVRGYADETIEELDLQPLPDELLGAGAKRLMNSANEIGYHWEPFRKFISPKRAKKGFCTGGTCMMGCTCGAKWTAASYVDDAVSLGAELFLKVKVNRVLIQDGIAVGVVGKTAEGDKDFWAKVIILSRRRRGHPGHPAPERHLQRGQEIFTDPVVQVYGVTNDVGSKNDPPMSVGTFKHYDERIVLSCLTDPSFLFPLMMAAGKPTKPWLALQTGKVLGIMVKVGDEMNGQIFKNERFNKPMMKTELDRLKKGTEISKKI